MSEKTVLQPPALVVGAIIIAAVSFGSGMMFQKTKGVFAVQGRFEGKPNSERQLGSMMQGNLGKNRMGFRPTTGEILATDENSITVKLTDGSSKIVLLSDKTILHTASNASRTDLVKGKNVMITGQENDDGSISATNVTINPVLINLGRGSQSTK